jgi:PST family polysaccharide transporter
VVLARLLTANDFGLVALALVFINYADVVTDLGVAQALVYFPDSRRRNQCAFLISLAVSLVLCATALAAAPAVARFFGRPDVSLLFQILSLSLVLRGLGQVPDALLRRELRFKRRLIAELSRAAVQGVLSILLAVIGFGPWALVFGYLAGSAVWSAAAWILCGVRPERGWWRLDRSLVRSLLAYGLPAAGTAWLLNLVFNVDYLIVGRLLGPQALGYYTVAFRIPELAIINVFLVISAVAFPVFSRARDDRARFERGYVLSLKLQAVYGMGAGVGLAVLAPLLVDVVFGPRWRLAAVPLQALALYAGFRALGMGATDLLKSIGRPGLLLALSMLRLAAVVPALVIATRQGINGVAWAQAAVALPLSLLIQVVAARVAGFSVPRVMRAYAPGLATGAGAALGALLILAVVPGPGVLRLVLGLAAAAAGGFGLLALVDRTLLQSTLGLIARDRPMSIAAQPGPVRQGG